MRKKSRKGLLETLKRKRGPLKKKIKYIAQTNTAPALKHQSMDTVPSLKSSLCYILQTPDSGETLCVAK